MGRNHDRRPRHRLVRAKGARLRLADTAARESNATRTVPDERRALVPFPTAHTGLATVVRFLAAPAELPARLLLLLTLAHVSLVLSWGLAPSFRGGLPPHPFSVVGAGPHTPSLSRARGRARAP